MLLGAPDAFRNHRIQRPVDHRKKGRVRERVRKGEGEGKRGRNDSCPTYAGIARQSASNPRQSAWIRSSDIHECTFRDCVSKTTLAGGQSSRSCRWLHNYSGQYDSVTASRASQRPMMLNLRNLNLPSKNNTAQEIRGARFASHEFP